MVQTIDAINNDPNVGSFAFRASSAWEDGTYDVGRISTLMLSD